MLKLSIGLVSLALALNPAIAMIPLWGQCGGVDYTGDTTCNASLTCVVFDQWYSQCQTPTSTATPTPTATSTSATTTSTMVVPASTGFVTTSGTQFILNGSKFTVVGENSYWIGLTGLSIANMNQAFADIVAAGLTVVCTWGFNEVTSPGPIAYYQSWSGSMPTSGK